MCAYRIIKSLELHESEPFGHIDRDIFQAAASAATSVSECAVELNSERFLRTFHPVLASLQQVMVYVVEPSNFYHNPSTCVWVVFELDGLRILKVGGRPVQLRPTSQITIQTPRPPYGYVKHPCAGHLPTTQFAPPHAIFQIREFFPGAIGVRVYRSGYASVLVPEDKRIKKGTCWISRPAEIGALNMLVEFLRIRPCLPPCLLRRQAMPEAALDTGQRPGLKFRLQDGTDVLTASTYCITSQVAPAPLQTVWQSVVKPLCREPFVPWLLRTLSSPMGISGSIPLLGKQVSFRKPGHNINVVISRVYDNPSATAPYPFGYEHDLSLVTPLLESNPSIMEALTTGNETESPVLKLEGFADAETVLSDRATGKLFAIQQAIHRDNSSEPCPPGRSQSTPASVPSTRPASSRAITQVVEAVQYMWERVPVQSLSSVRESTYSTSLLWRAHVVPSTPSSRVSSPYEDQFEGPEILCIRKPKARTENSRKIENERAIKANVVVFQNFECTVETLVPVDSSDKEEDCTQVQFEGDTYRLEPMKLKGGFVLPEEVLEAEILGFASRS
ncbi:hypothetical protein BDN72DRAFT_956764 [Pluteus cervinus]|uniref:Uncharacterized protein n=1 Tax=Pluteus cervinus TaxID=181527 RepID=A0ACD3B4V8_9AGAR|nr:hypothetical protein BDN72DRAFT_956764 [Pluteus cervinus]